MGGERISNVFIFLGAHPLPRPTDTDILIEKPVFDRPAPSRVTFSGFLDRERGSGHGIHYAGTAIPGLSVLQIRRHRSRGRWLWLESLTALTPARTSCAHHGARRLIQGNASGGVDMPRIFPGHLLANALEMDSGSAHRED